MLLLLLVPSGMLMRIRYEMIIEGVTIVYHLSMNEAKKAPLMRSNCWQYDIYGDKGENLWLSIQLEEIGIKQKFLSFGIASERLKLH